MELTFSQKYLSWGLDIASMVKHINNTLFKYLMVSWASKQRFLLLLMPASCRSRRGR